MSKSQHGNREAKKPKKAPPAPLPTGTSAALPAIPAANPRANGRR